jgi:RNA polymerase sigma-70 factor (ECF subfamily)
VAEFCEPADELANKEQRAEIASAISRLSRHQAVATLMRIVEEQSYEDIAAALGCAPATARRHVARGRERLRVLLAHLTPSD